MSQKDLEKGTSQVEVSSDTGIVEPAPSRGFFRDFVDGFKPVNLDSVDTAGMTPAEVAAVLTARQPLKRSLKNRHIQMIAIGGSIGSGLFIGSGNSFKSGGPAAVIIGFSIIGMMIFCTMNALGEMAVRLPVSGSFSVYSSRFLDPSWGFAMGWSYALQWLVVYPLELVAASMVIGFWDDDNNGATNVSKAAWVALFWSVIFMINIFGVRGYGEAEFILAITKVVAIIGFCIYGIVVAAGGGPGHHYYGAHYWHDPGSFAAGVKGVVSVFVNAAFAFGGTEMAGLAAAETENPAKSLPKAVKQVFWRILLFYIVSLTIVSMLVPYNHPRLGATSNGSASPFVIAITNVGIHGLPSVMNVVIISAVLSVANSSVYGCSRTLASLGATGQAPKIFSYIDRQGRPLVAVATTLIFGLLGFLAASDKHGEVFDWMLAFSGLSFIFAWGSINLSHIRFRMGMRAQGHSTEELAFKAAAGIYGSIVGFIINLAVVCLQFWIAVWPIGKSPDATTFFKAYLSVPVAIAFYACHKIYCVSTGQGFSLFIRSKDMDVTTGMRDLDIDKLKADNAEEAARIRARGYLYRVYHFWC